MSDTTSRDDDTGPVQTDACAATTGLSAMTTRRAALRALAAMPAIAPLLSACGGGLSSDFFQSKPEAPPAQPQTVGTGQIRIGLILPLSSGGNAGAAAESMKNAAEMALAEFQNPNIQLLVKDDAGNAQTAQQVAQQALSEGAEMIIGPLFALTVPNVAAAARARNVPVIAFSTDSSVAGRGVYLLSFLPESDVNRIVEYAASTGKRSFAAMVPDNAYGNVMETAFKQAVALVAALVKTQGPQRFAPQVLTNTSGFTGIDGLFRFRADGTNDRGLAVMRVTPSGGQIVSPPSKNFSA